MYVFVRFEVCIIWTYMSLWVMFPPLTHMTYTDIFVGIVSLIK